MEEKPKVLDHIGLAKKVVRKYKNKYPHVPIEDFIGVTNLALVDAVRCFTPGGEAKFSTYATLVMSRACFKYAVKERMRGMGRGGTLNWVPKTVASINDTSPHATNTQSEYLLGREDKLVDFLEVELVHKAMQLLTAKQKLAIQRFVDGLSGSDIGKETGRTPSLELKNRKLAFQRFTEIYQNLRICHVS